MRLICPSCGAQYEVAEDVISQAGRDVQCSNCAHTWMVQPETPVSDEPTTPPPPPQPTPRIEPKERPSLRRDSPPVQKPVERPAATLETAQPTRRELAPDVADILREEAQFEQSARNAEQTEPEARPDMASTLDDDEPQNTEKVSERIARLRGNAEISAAVSATLAEDAAMPRHELLPDIEEINSSLRGDTNVSDSDYEGAPRRRSKFRRGFMFVVFIALIALAVYIFTPQISAAVPEAEPTLTAYVDWVDARRIWLDQKVQELIAQTRGDGAADTGAAPADPSPADTADTDATPEG